jgi:hypothetical protein
MIQLATEQHIPYIVEGMLALKQQTGWAAYDQPGYNRDTLTAYTTARLYDPQSVCYLWCDGDGTPVAFCGASLSTFHLPPHMPLVFEWGWFGRPRAAAQCWQACMKWGKKHGATLAFYSRSTPGQRKDRVIEHQTWRVL